MAPQPTVDIVIPNFNGKHLLVKNLSEIVNNTKPLNTVIIVDNGSTDGSVEWLTQNYPGILVIQNKSNLGFTTPVNQGVKASSAEYVVLLNNDVQPTSNYLHTVFDYFTDPNLFAVSFNETHSSWPKLTWQGGKIQYLSGEDKSAPYYSAWASGGSAIFRRSLWDKLGGFNPIYSPWYWEDIDIGYRAWKTGYKIIWDNSSHVIHNHESTSLKLNPHYVNLVRQRNELLFNWLNITDPELVSAHKKYLLSYTLSHPGYLKVIISAYLRYLITPHFKKPAFIYTDKEVLKLVNNKYV